MTDTTHPNDWLHVGEGHTPYRELFDAESDLGKLIVAGLVSWTIQLQLRLEHGNEQLTPEEFQAYAREALHGQVNFERLFEEALKFLREIGWSHNDLLGNTPEATEARIAATHEFLYGTAPDSSETR